MGRIKEDYFPYHCVYADYGFEYGDHSGPRCEAGWTKIISHSNGLYDLWVTIDGHTLYLYDEYNVGGMTFTSEEHIPDELTSETEILNYVDEIVTEYLSD